MHHPPAPTDFMAPHPPLRHHAPLEIAPDTFLIRSVFGEGQGPVAVYVNSMVIAGPEPVVVDTGTLVNREQWMEDVFSIVDPSDIAYVFLSHDDHDHVGNLVPLLELAPQAILVSSWFSMERLAGDAALPLERMRWLNDGDTFEAAGRTLALVRPPLYDAPTTRGLFDPKTGVYWAVDTYGVPVVEPVDDVGELDPAFWDEMFVPFNGMNSPWHSIVDRDLHHREIARVTALEPTVLASAHGPAITGANVAEAHRKMHRVAQAAPAPVPTQLDLDTLLATLVAPGAEPEPQLISA